MTYEQRADSIGAYLYGIFLTKDDQERRLFWLMIRTCIRLNKMAEVERWA